MARAAVCAARGSHLSAIDEKIIETPTRRAIDPDMETSRIVGAEVVVPCTDLAQTLAFFTDELGFALHSIYPADAPAVAEIEGFGLRLRLDRHASGSPGTLRLLGHNGVVPREWLAPNGMRIELVDSEAPRPLPALQPRFVVTRGGADAQWETGRAGMRYRDLIPGRLGGRYIASHIRIPEGGPVPDYVHHHAIRWQMIFCRAGWVRVVYEDQGPAFVMHAGDCVLQPPHIRHRVLESSPALEVIEIACPALHETRTDRTLDLPNAVINPDHDFHGQLFVRHVAAQTPWQPWHLAGFECRNTGIDAATRGLADVRVVRARGADSTPAQQHESELRFLFILEGAMTLRARGEDHALTAGDCVTIPAGLAHELGSCSADLQWLDVTS